MNTYYLLYKITIFTITIIIFLLLESYIHYTINKINNNKLLYNSKNFLNRSVINAKRHLNLNSVTISCDIDGVCSRSDGIQLKAGWLSKKTISINLSSIDSLPSKSVISKHPYYNLNFLIYIKGSNRFRCADGVNECFNSCCNKGFCSDPSNACTEALKRSDSIIYGTCIGFFTILILYWTLFGVIGAKYSKNKMKILLEQDNTVKKTYESNIKSMYTFNDLPMSTKRTDTKFINSNSN